MVQLLEKYQELPVDFRETMALFIHEELAYGEITAVAGCSPKTVESRNYRARQLLETKLRHPLS